MTGLAMLAFTRFAHTHEVGLNAEYVAAQARALEFLKRCQVRGTGNPRLDGAFGPPRPLPPGHADGHTEGRAAWIYDQAIATAALASLLSVSKDTGELKGAVEDAAMFCLRAQNPGSGWGYGMAAAPNTSVTGWMVAALKAVRTCVLLELVSRPSEEELEKSFAGALAWLASVTDESTGIVGYRTAGDRGARDVPGMTALAMWCRLMAGERRSGAPLRRGVEVLVANVPKWGPGTNDFCYWFWGTYAVFQYGGACWRDWNRALQEVLVEHQHREEGSCLHGSWDPADGWGPLGGRVYATALASRALMVYYHWEGGE